MWWDYKSQALFNREYFIFILYFVGGKNKNVAVMMRWWQIKHFSWQRYIHAYICICLGYNIISRAGTIKFFDQCLLHQIAREIMLLLVNDLHEKKSLTKSQDRLNFGCMHMLSVICTYFTWKIHLFLPIRRKQFFHVYYNNWCSRLLKGNW